MKKSTIIGLFSEYFLTGRSWRDKLGIALNRYQRGNELLNIPKDLLIILGLGSLIMGRTFDFIPGWALPLIGILWITGCYTFGYLDEKYGFWKNQQKHLAGTINPIMKQISEDIKEIKNKINNNVPIKK